MRQIGMHKALLINSALAVSDLVFKASFRTQAHCKFVSKEQSVLVLTPPNCGLAAHVCACVGLC